MRPDLSRVTGSLLRSAGHGWRLRARWSARASSYGRPLFGLHCCGDRAYGLHGGLLHRLSDSTRLGLRVAPHTVLSGPGSHFRRSDVRVHLRIAANSLLPHSASREPSMPTGITGVRPRRAWTG